MMKLLSNGIFAGGSRRSKVLRFVLWAASMAGLLVGMFGDGHGHWLRFTAILTADLCALGYYLEYLRVRPRDKGELVVLDLKERAQ